MEVTTAVRRHLLSVDAVRGYVGARVFKHRLEEKVDGTGRCAVVVKRTGGWASPDPIKTSEYPILLLEFHADPSRNEYGEIEVSNAEDRAWSLFRVVDPVLHGKRDQWWGGMGTDPGLKVITSARNSEPDLTAQSDQHSSAPPLGDSVFVTVRYSLEVVH